MPPYPHFHFLWFQLPGVNHGPKAGDLNPKAMSQLLSIHLSSSRHVGTLSSHIITRRERVSTGQ